MTPRLRTLGRYVLLTLVAAVFAGPFLILLTTALKPGSQPVYSFPPDLLPVPRGFEARSHGALLGAFAMDRL